MLRFLSNRLVQYVLLAAIASALFLPRLGAADLWDIDEGNNGTAAYEMMERMLDDPQLGWITPTFNHELRVDKPALIYWLQILAYSHFGVCEFAARLPLALASILTVLLTCELGRRMFNPITGLLAGTILASSILFCGSAHFANPDALLSACIICTMLFFWDSYRSGSSRWMIWCGLTTGIGFLAKGPIALALPSAVTGLFLLWNRELRRLIGPRLLIGGVIWVLVAVPWFAFVGADTKGEFLRGFFLRHNLERFTTPMEGHSGPFYYHVISLILGFLPWSAFLISTLTFACLEARGWRKLEERLEVTEEKVTESSAIRLLLCWMMVTIVVFSISWTKLPNYILPMYPALALLTAHYLASWHQGRIAWPAWVMKLSLACWLITGAGTVLIVLYMAGALPMRPTTPILSGLEALALLGAPLLSAVIMGGVCLYKNWRTGLVTTFAGAAVIFIGTGACFGITSVNHLRAPKELVATLSLQQPTEEIRIGCYRWFEPSVVFYCQHQVERVWKEKQAADFLKGPLPAYLFITEDDWRKWQDNPPCPCHYLGQHWEIYSDCNIVVVSNRHLAAKQ